MNRKFKMALSLVIPFSTVLFMVSAYAAGPPSGDPQAPPAPTGVTAKVNENNSITLIWNPVDGMDNLGPGKDKYDIQWGVDQNSPSEDVAYTTSFITQANLPAGTYYFRVRAFDKDKQGQDQQGEWSDWVSATITAESTNPPVASVEIIYPEDGDELYTDFMLALSATPASGKIVKQGTVVPRILLSPEDTLTADVVVSYGNSGGKADGELKLMVDGEEKATFSLDDFEGTAEHTFAGVQLSEGMHTIEVNLSLENDDGESSAEDSVTASVSSIISEIESLSFTVTGPGTPKYIGKLTYSIVNLSNGDAAAGGNLGDSSASFNSLTLPTTVSAGQSLRLQEPIHINLTGAGTITITVSVTANGQTHTASASFTALP